MKLHTVFFWLYDNFQILVDTIFMDGIVILCRLKISVKKLLNIIMYHCIQMKT
jgi:hypothetical protein